MKKDSFRLIVLLLCIACLSLPMFSACADTGDDLLNQVRTVPDFKFQQHKTGIGKGTLNVYTAPSNSSYRVGRAAVDISGEIAESGRVDDWLLVRYKTSKDLIRIGYIHGNEIKDFKSSMPQIKGDMIPVTAANKIQVTDGPVRKPAYFGTIEPGQTFWILRKYTYTGNWWYVECTIEGKTARGFISRKDALFCLGAGADISSATAYNIDTLGYPEISPRNTGIIGHFQVAAGPRKLVRADADSNSTQITVAYFDRYYPCYDFVDAGNGKGWYYIWVEEDSKWGWIHSTNGELIRD